MVDNTLTYYRICEAVDTVDGVDIPNEVIGHIFKTFPEYFDNPIKDPKLNKMLSTWAWNDLTASYALPVLIEWGYTNIDKKSIMKILGW